MNNRLILEKIEDKSIAFIENILKENYLVYEDIRDEHIELFLAYKSSNCIGIIGLEQFGEIGLLRSLVIFDKYRNHGYGKEICNCLFDYAKNKKIKEIYLLTVTAKNFFEKIGFSLVKRKHVPEEIKNTGEFSHLCPDSAACLKINL